MGACIGRHIREHGDYCGAKTALGSEYCRDCKCSVRGCPNKRGITWPLCGDVGLCSAHYDKPPSTYADLVTASKAPPDDFDIPEWDLPLPPRLPRYLTADKDTWVTKDNQAIPIRELGDNHLGNIHRMLGRIQAEIDEVDEEGHPAGKDLPPDVRKMFARKVSAIKGEIRRREAAQ